MAIQDNNNGWVPPEVAKSQSTQGWVPPEVSKKKDLQEPALGGDELDSAGQFTWSPEQPQEPPVDSAPTVQDTYAAFTPIDQEGAAPEPTITLKETVQTMGGELQVPEQFQGIGEARQPISLIGEQLPPTAYEAQEQASYTAFPQLQKLKDEGRISLEEFEQIPSSTLADRFVNGDTNVINYLDKVILDGFGEYRPTDISEVEDISGTTRLDIKADDRKKRLAAQRAKGIIDAAGAALEKSLPPAEAQLKSIEKDISSQIAEAQRQLNVALSIGAINQDEYNTEMSNILFQQDQILNSQIFSKAAEARQALNRATALSTFYNEQINETPEALQWAKVANNTIWSGINDIATGGTKFLQSFRDVARDLVGGDIFTDIDYAEQWNPAIDVAFGFTDVITQEEIEQVQNPYLKTIAQAGVGVLQSLPAIAVPNGVGIFAQMYGYAADEAEAKGLNSGEALLYSTAQAGVASALERFGFRNMMTNRAVVGQIANNAIRSLNRSGNKITMQGLQRAINNETKSFIPNYFSRIAGGAAAEFETGAMQAISEGLIKEITNAVSDRTIFNPDEIRLSAEDILYQGMLEAIGGAMMSSVFSLASRESFDFAEMSNKQIDFLSNAIANNSGFDIQFKNYLDAKVAKEEMTSSEKDITLERYENLKEKLLSVPSDYSANDKREVLDLISERTRLEQVKSRLADGTDSRVNTQIEAINNRINEIDSKYKADETQEQQEQAVLEGVRDGGDETQAGAEGTQLRAEAEEEVTPSEGTQAEAPLQQPTPRVVPEAEAQPGDYFTREIDGETLVYQKQDGAPHRMLSVDEANAFLEEQRAMQEQQAAPPTPAPQEPVQAAEPVGSTLYKENAPTHVAGRERTITIADGSKISGQYKVVSADEVLASHNEKTFSKTPNFPTNEQGKTVNDRDYETDRAAQSEVVRIAGSLDARAITQTPVVTKDGIVVDGNNRTMSRKLAASQGTDAEYMEALMRDADMYGIDPAQIASIKNPMLIFEPNTPIPYTTTEFARFNKAEKKEKSPIEKAVELSKTISDRARRVLGGIYESAERPSDVTSNRSTMNDVKSLLLDEGILQANEIPRYINPETGTATKEGVAFLETLLMGSALNENVIRMLDNEGMGTAKQRIMESVVQITQNAGLGENSLQGNIEQGIDLLNRAISTNQTVLNAISQMDMFEVSKYSAEDLAIAILLDGQGFKKFLKQYNAEVDTESLFEGKLTKEKIIDNLLSQKITNYEQVRENIRINAERRSQEVQEARGSYQQEEQRKQEIDAIQEREAAEVPMGEQAEGGQEVQPTQQEAEAEVEAVAEKTGVKAKNLRDLYNVNRDVFGLNRLESLTNAIVMDRMVGAMAKRAGISKEAMYGRLEFVKGGIAPKGALLQQADFWKSTAKEGVGKIQQKAATPEQWVKMITDKGGKGTNQELEWIGLADYLNEWVRENNAKSVPREVVEQYINDNQIEIVEVAKGSVGNFSTSFLGTLTPPDIESKINYIKENQQNLTVEQNRRGTWNIYDRTNSPIPILKEVGSKDLANDIIKNPSKYEKAEPTQYSQYTLKGGENYREVLLTLPQEKPASEYKSSHWNETNIVAHLRINERTLPNGERVMFIEEVQSDWAQEGKKRGFASRVDENRAEELRKLIDEQNERRNNATTEEVRLDAIEKRRPLVRELTELNKKRQGIKDMPYKKTDQWVGMAMRRAMQMAAQEGFDRVAWVTGEQSAERYDLSRYVDSIQHSTKDGENYRISTYGKDGNTIDVADLKANELEGYFGKEIAEKIINKEGKPQFFDDRTFLLENQDIKLGGEGMKTFYNSILPKVAKKEAQRFDKKATVDVVDFSDIEIIELEVKEGVKNSGQKFWYASGRVNGNLKTGTSTKSREDAISKLKEKSTGASKQLSIAITPEMRMNLNSAVPLFQGEQGAMLAADGKAIIYALSNPNVSTPLHEMAHVFEHYLTDAEKRSVLRWAGKKEWDTGVSEKFARGAEKYLADGKAPTFSLQKIFDKFKQWLTDIYNGIKGSEIDLQLNDGMRDIYSKMLGVEVEQAAEQEAVGDADQTARNYGFTNKHHAKNAIQKYLGEDVDADAITEDQVRRASEARAAGTVEQQMEAEQVGTRNVKNTGIAVNVDLKGIWDWTAKKWRKYTKSRGLLPKNVFDKYIRMVGSESAALKQVDRLRTRLDRAVKNDFGTTYNKMSAQQKTQLDLALRGDVNAMNNLPIATREVIADMRRQVDALSQMVIDLGLVEGELEIVLQENMGTYLTRSYRKFEDPDWISNVPEQIVNRAKNFIRQENPELTQDEVDGLLTYLLQKDAGTDLNIFQKAPIGSKGKVINLLKGRKEIPFELRQLYGEYSDPFINYSKSITKIASLLARDQFLKGVREDGLNVYLFERPTGEYNVPIAGAKSKALEPLNGLFTTKDISDAFRSLDPADPVFDGGLDHVVRMYLRLNGLVKAGKTIASPQTHFRNFYGNILIMVNNGYLFDSQTYREISPTFNKVYKDLLNKGDKDFENYLLKLTRLRVTDESVNANDLKGIIKDIDIKEGGVLDWIQSSQAGKIIKATQKGATKLYQAEDDFYKIIAFEVESRRLKDAYGDTKTQEWIDERAAQKVRMILPTYSLVPKFIKQLRRFPFVGTFVSFPFEIIRTYGNTINLAYQELNSPQERAIGQKRAAGIMLNTLLVPTISALSAALIGVDDEERQAARRMMAPWTENSDILWLERGDDGLPRFIDMGYSDPYNYLRKPINTIVLGIKNGEQPIPLVVEAGSEMLKPFAGEEILARHVREVLSNKKTQTGSAVYNPQDEWDNITIDILEHLSKALEPGGVSSARRIYKGFNKEAQSTGRVYDPTEEILAIPTGQRWQRIDPLYAVQFKFGDAMDAMQDAKRIYNSAKYRGDDINAAYEQSTNRQEQIYNDLKADYDAAMKLMSKTKGVDQTKNELDKILKDAGFNSTLRNQLRSGGGYLPFDIESGRQTKPEGSSRTRQTRTRELRTRSATTRDLR